MTTEWPATSEGKVAAGSWISGASPGLLSARRSKGGTSRSIALASYNAARRLCPFFSIAISSFAGSMIGV